MPGGVCGWLRSSAASAPTVRTRRNATESTTSSTTIRVWVSSMFRIRPIPNRRLPHLLPSGSSRPEATPLSCPRPPPCPPGVRFWFLRISPSVHCWLLSHTCFPPSLPAVSFILNFILFFIFFQPKFLWVDVLFCVVSFFGFFFFFFFFLDKTCFQLASPPWMLCMNRWTGPIDGPPTSRPRPMAPVRPVMSMALLSLALPPPNHACTSRRLSLIAPAAPCSLQERPNRWPRPRHRSTVRCWWRRPTIRPPETSDSTSAPWATSTRRRSSRPAAPSAATWVSNCRLHLSAITCLTNFKPTAPFSS